MVGFNGVRLGNQETSPVFPTCMPHPIIHRHTHSPGSQQLPVHHHQGVTYIHTQYHALCRYRNTTAVDLVPACSDSPQALLAVMPQMGPTHRPLCPDPLFLGLLCSRGRHVLSVSTNNTVLTHRLNTNTPVLMLSAWGSHQLSSLAHTRPILLLLRPQSPHVQPVALNSLALTAHDGMPFRGLVYLQLTSVPAKDLL